MKKQKELEPFFALNSTCLYNGSVLNTSNFKKEFCDLIVTSPPYNVGIKYNSSDDVLSYEDYLSFTKKWLTNCLLWTRDTGRMILNITLDKNKYGQ
jgi:site-specific DNA-methyltransferase (adenine-specific)